MPWDTTLKESRQPRAAPPVLTLQLLFSPPDGICDTPPAPLRRGVTVIGRAADQVDIALPNDPRVSRRHAQLLVRSGAQPVQLTDLSSTQTTVNGKAVHEASLASGDVIRCGDSFALLRRQRAAVEPDDGDPAVAGLVGQAPAMRAVRRTLKLAGRSGSTVLLLGETGTGKELAARAVHDASGRGGAFVAVNCSAIAEALAEAQLFGHVAGSYTGAKADAPGFFRAAAGGTLFLDEVGELTPAIQPKLLRALEERAVTPVGATQPVPCDVRVVAATNRDLVGEVSAQRFRADLYARLAELVIEMPPLRDRREDVLTLFAGALGQPLPELEPDLVEALLLHQWPFNVRELRQLASRAGALAPSAECLGLDMFSNHFDRLGSSADAQPTPQTSPAQPGDVAESSVAGPAPDRGQLEDLLRQHGGVVADIARATGRSRKQVYRWLQAHGLDADDFR